MDSKSPAMILNERCAKQGLPPPQYTYEQIQATPKTLFQAMCQVTMNGRLFVASGMGQRKKDAQHNAAKSMFRDQLQISFDDTEAFNILRPVRLEEDVEREGGPGAVAEWNERANMVEDEEFPEARIGNPIAELLDLCVRKNLPEPEYEDLDMVGPPHCPVLPVICNVGTLKMQGCSKTKKLAKRIAALKVLKELKTRFAGQDDLSSFKKTIAAQEEENSAERQQAIACIRRAEEEGTIAVRVSEKSPEELCSDTVFRRRHELTEKLVEKPGGIFASLKTKARELDYLKPFEKLDGLAILYSDWVKDKGGISIFFAALKAELKFEDEYISIRTDDEDGIGVFVALTVTFPGVEMEPTFTKVVENIGDRPEEEVMNCLKDKLKLDFICYLGTTCVTRTHILRKR